MNLESNKCIENCPVIRKFKLGMTPLMPIATEQSSSRSADILLQAGYATRNCPGPFEVETLEQTGFLRWKKEAIATSLVCGLEADMKTTDPQTRIP